MNLIAYEQKGPQQIVYHIHMSGNKHNLLLNHLNMPS